jgi:hypothetical protein
MRFINKASQQTSESCEAFLTDILSLCYNNIYLYELNYCHALFRNSTQLRHMIFSISSSE